MVCRDMNDVLSMVLGSMCCLSARAYFFFDSQVLDVQKLHLFGFSNIFFPESLRVKGSRLDLYVAVSGG